jgi:hypothetical protein
MQYYLTDRLAGEQAAVLSAFVETSGHCHLYQHPGWVWVSGKTHPHQYLYFWGQEDDEIRVSALVRRMRLPLAGWAMDTVERGPVCDDGRLLVEATDRLAGLLRARASASLTVNPYWTQPESATVEADLAHIGFEIVERYSAPHSHSLVIDLSPTEAEILASFRKSTRKDIRAAEKMGVVTAPAQSEADVEAFWQLYQHAAKSKGLGLLERDYLMRLWRRFLADRHFGLLSMARYGGQLISADITLRHGTHAEDTYGPSRLDVWPEVPKSHLCVWEAIRWAKACGCVTFDLGGFAADARAGSPLYNINQFKLGFSKQVVQLVRELRLILRPAVHDLLVQLHQLRRAVRT